MGALVIPTQVNLPERLYYDDLEPDQSYIFEYQLDASAWADTTRFPCLSSDFEPELPACDYNLHGYQTLASNPRVELFDTLGEQRCLHLGWGSHALLQPAAGVHASLQDSCPDWMPPCSLCR